MLLSRNTRADQRKTRMMMMMMMMMMLQEDEVRQCLQTLVESSEVTDLQSLHTILKQ